MRRLTTVVVVAIGMWLAGCEDVAAQTYVGTLRNLADRAAPAVPDATVTVTQTGPTSDPSASIRVVIDGCTLSLVRVRAGAWELEGETATCETGLVTSAHAGYPYSDAGATLTVDVWWSDGPTLADSRHVDFWGTRR